ncbi:MAG: 4Fe-4S dicluster domain-containing protein [Chloroflexi bacterium]|nr:4Fe-4S dicluster domain-containing protein [Chloroflexota bacterium]
MTEEVYRALARRLDATPNGFPASRSGVELRMLAKVFTPEEAALAAQTADVPETAEEIAGRAGLDTGRARQLLKQMTRMGHLRVERREGALRFALLPWAPGIYENQLPRLDAELAALAEAYFHEVGPVGYGSPPIHRVLPVREAVPFELRVHPYGEARALIEGAQSWGVRDCICRVQQRLVGKGCDRPVENCLVFAPAPHVFDHAEVDRAISKEEALRILEEAEAAGLVHTTGNWREGHNYICNCCTCCCAVRRSLAEFHHPTAVAGSGYRATVDESLCVGCGDCLERCQFGALAMPAYTCQVDAQRCVGCGLCTTVCPSGALALEPLSPEAAPVVPPDAEAWRQARRQSRQARS